MNKYILSLDQGTSSSRAIIFNKELEIVGTKQKEYPQIYPKPGWVEHDPEQIWESQFSVANNLLKDCNIKASEIFSFLSPIMRARWHLIMSSYP